VAWTYEEWARSFLPVPEAAFAPWQIASVLGSSVAMGMKLSPPHPFPIRRSEREGAGWRGMSRRHDRVGHARAAEAGLGPRSLCDGGADARVASM
jgi:hypothetical protein